MWLPLVFAIGLLFQSTAVKPLPNEALKLLNDVAQRYAQAKSYHIEATEERTFSNELSRSWEKTLMTAVVAPGGRYRYEGRSGEGSAILVSDGTTQWAYHLHEHLYTQKAVSDTAPPPRAFSPEEFPVMEAKRLVSGLAALARRLNSATLLPDETILVNGRGVQCNVVRFTQDDLKTRSPDIKSEGTIWIDKSRMVIVKRASRTDSYVGLPGSRAHIPYLMESTTIFSVVELDEAQPESAFTFSAPPDAELVESFPDPRARTRDMRASEFVGKPAPEVRFPTPDGKRAALSAFRGKPVFLDFWATSCAPCVKLMPDLKKLYAETAPKGLAWISIDNDEDPDTVTKYLATEQIPWPNYHDADGLLGKAFGRDGIPLAVLIGADGTVKFYAMGYSIAELRAAIANLGPEFSAINPAP
jgi:thiol-disulfide isomerase/thioredoxin